MSTGVLNEFADYLARRRDDPIAPEISALYDRLKHQDRAEAMLLEVHGTDPDSSAQRHEIARELLRESDRRLQLAYESQQGGSEPVVAEPFALVLIEEHNGSLADVVQDPRFRSWLEGDLGLGSGYEVVNDEDGVREEHVERTADEPENVALVEAELVRLEQVARDGVGPDAYPSTLDTLMPKLPLPEPDDLVRKVLDELERGEHAGHVKLLIGDMLEVDDPAQFFDMLPDARQYIHRAVAEDLVHPTQTAFGTQAYEDALDVVTVLWNEHREAPEIVGVVHGPTLIDSSSEEMTASTDDDADKDLVDDGQDDAGDAGADDIDEDSPDARVVVDVDRHITQSATLVASARKLLGLPARGVGKVAAVVRPLSPLATKFQGVVGTATTVAVRDMGDHSTGHELRRPGHHL